MQVVFFSIVDWVSRAILLFETFAATDQKRDNEINLTRKYLKLMV